jgi:hypothetical protein
MTPCQQKNNHPATISQELFGCIVRHIIIAADLSTGNVGNVFSLLLNQEVNVVSVLTFFPNISPDVSDINEFWKPRYFAQGHSVAEPLKWEDYGDELVCHWQDSRL